MLVHMRPGGVQHENANVQKKRKPTKAVQVLHASSGCCGAHGPTTSQNCSVQEVHQPEAQKHFPQSNTMYTLSMLFEA